MAVAAAVGLAFACRAPAPAGATSCPNEAVRSAISAHLPDCRAYEQASPVDKDGIDAVSLQPTLPAQAAPCWPGEACRLAYTSLAGAFAGAEGNEKPNAYLTTRLGGEWANVALTPPTPQAPGTGTPVLTYAFSGDLTRMVVRVPLQRLTESAPANVYNLYLQTLPGGPYSLVTASEPATPPQSGCGGCYLTEDVPAFAGASADFSHVLFEANDSLLAQAPGGGVENLYEAIGEHVRLVGVLPDGTVPPEGSTPGGGLTAINLRARQVERAISSDGTHVVFQAAADAGAPAPQQVGLTEVYDRIDGSETVEVSAPAPGAQPGGCETLGALCKPEPAQFWGASTDGSLVLFTSHAALTKTSYTGAEAEGGENPGNDLYLYDVAGRSLADLTAEAPSEADPNGAQVLGVVGVSQDGSYVYFVADGALAGGATSGQPNLYVWHGSADGSGQIRFIATLAAPSAGEEASMEHERTHFLYRSDVADWASHPALSQAYVTPDGRSVAFMSVDPLTGYDNRDQVSGEPDHEVYLYGYESDRLLCASCDPNGARPLGSAFIGAKLTERSSTPFHQPRSLNDEGSRLFFSSPDPLADGVAGGSVKVYELEQGAIRLISGTGSGSDDAFLDASASGDDVFFATRERLAAGDEDELVDVYDARVGGGFAPAPHALPSCAIGACETVIPPAAQTPTSLGYVGPGNLPAPAARRAPTRSQLLAKALAKCRRIHARKRRAACVRAARRRYPSHQASRRARNRAG